MFRLEFKRRGYKPTVLSRTVEDSGTVTSVLIPWNTCGAYHTGVLGISTFAYFPYCFFNIINPILSLIYGFTGFHMEKLVRRRLDEAVILPPPRPVLNQQVSVMSETRAADATVGNQLPRGRRAKGVRARLDDAGRRRTQHTGRTAWPNRRTGLQKFRRHKIMQIVLLAVAIISIVVLKTSRPASSSLDSRCSMPCSASIRKGKRPKAWQRCARC